MNNDFSDWWLPYRKKGKNNFIKKIILSIASSLLSGIIVLGLLSGKIYSMMMPQYILFVIIVTVLMGIFSYFIGIRLWIKYETLYSKK